MTGHQPLQHLGGQENAAQHAGSQRYQGKDMKGADVSYNGFIDSQHIEHLRHADSGQDQPHRNDESPSQLKEQGRGPEASVRCKKPRGNQRQEHHPQDAYDRIGHRSQVQLFHACLPVYHGNTPRHRSQEEKPERNIGPGCEQIADKARKQHHSGSCPQNEFEQKGHASCRFLEKGADG